MFSPDTVGKYISSPLETSNIVYTKKGKIKKEDRAADVLQESESSPRRAQVKETILDLNDDDDSQGKEKEQPKVNTPEAGNEMEDQLEEIVLGFMEISAKETPNSTQIDTSILDLVVVQTLSAMSSSTLGPITPSTSSSSFFWVQSFLDNKKRKGHSNYSSSKAVCSDSPSWHYSSLTKKDKVNSRLTSYSQGQQFIEIANPNFDKDERDLSLGDLELTRIPIGESTP